MREARSAAKLRHPNIVQAHDVGFAEGYYFLAMEFVDGETLSRIVAREGPLEQNRALEVMKQTCSALAAPHEAGVVHRDIKPSNIMIDKNGEVRVTDFGLAKRTEGEANVTADGKVLGTPAYLAPEMAKGAEVDARSDLYSLAATTFYALAGRPPFEDSNFPEVLIKQATQPAPPLATAATGVDRRLCHIIERLLRKNPEARYPSAKAKDTEAREAAARDPWRGILAASKGDLKPAQARRVLGSIDTLGAKYGTTKLADSVRDDRTALRARLLEVAQGWMSLFDGKTLKGWAVVEGGRFAKHGRVYVKDGGVFLDRGVCTTGIAWQSRFAEDNYEVELEAMRLEGPSDFCMLYFPIGQQRCVWKTGGERKGTTSGLDKMNGQRFDSNPSTMRMAFQRGRWYRIRLRVAVGRVQGWIDQRAAFDVPTEGIKFPPDPAYEPLSPFGLASWGDKRRSPPHKSAPNLGPRRRMGLGGWQASEETTWAHPSGTQARRMARPLRRQVARWRASGRRARICQAWEGGSP